MSPRASASVALAVHDLGIPVVELLRVSTEAQALDTRAGLERQRESNRRTILAKGLNCIKTVELHVSGTVAPVHPKMLEVFAMLSTGAAKGIVLSDLDRMFRPDTPSGYAALQIFQDCGAKIFCSDTDYDLTTSNGLLQSAIRSAISGFELSLIKERMQGAKEAKRRAGKCPTNKLTLALGIGYDRETDTWHYTPEIALVRELFSLYLSGTRNFSELGRRVGMSGASARVILKNPVYTGWRIISQKRGAKRVSRSGKLYRAKVPRDENDIIKVRILDGIVTPQEFELAQAELAKSVFNHNSRFRSNDRVNLGTGIAFCACGQPLMCVSGRNKHGSVKTGYYQCRTRHYAFRAKLDGLGGCLQKHLRSDHVDAAILTLASRILTDPDSLARILEASAIKSAELITPFAKIVEPSQHLSELARRDRRVCEAYEGGAMSVDELRAKREIIRKERAAIERLSTPKAASGKTEWLQMARVVVKVAHRFTGITDKREQKEIIHELLSEVHIRQSQIISLRFRPSAFAGVAGESAAGSKVILLPEPFWVGEPPDVLPPDHRRCIKCSAVKPVSEFYRKFNRCKPCVAYQQRERDKRRRVKSNG